MANLFLTLPGWKIRGLSRDPSKPSAQSWVNKGVEIVAGDLDDVDKVKAAFKGSNVIFGNTDFWQYFFTPQTQEQAKQEGRSPNEVAYDIEVRQGLCCVQSSDKHR